MTELQTAILLADLALIVVVARLAGRLARAWGQPPVMGEIVVGILAAPTLLDGAIAETLFPHDVRPYLGALADLGLVLFMFIVGLEFDSSRLRGSGRVVGVTALGATSVPFGLGCLLALRLADSDQATNRLSFVLFIGVALSVTAFPVLGSVFKDHRMVDHGGVIRRHELTDQEWELLAPLIPRAATGRPRAGDRQVINGMVYKIRTGISWRDLPERYGPWKTVYTRFRRYALDGVFTRALKQIQAPGRTPPVTSTGSSRSTPPSSAPTSTPPPPAEKGATPAGRTG
ncbi:transposase [Streptomyces antimycoticus]|uniref:transposase n=1 Tax=Streptomyces antimycoticus TaxID=68175 RepID=UPI003F4DA7FD